MQSYPHHNESDTMTDQELEHEERKLFAAHMVTQGFRPDAVAPPVPPRRFYPGSHIQDAWQDWVEQRGLNLRAKPPGQ